MEQIVGGPQVELLYLKAQNHTKLEHGAGVLPEIVDEGAHISVEDDGSALPLGWALKSAGVTRKNVTVAHFQIRKYDIWAYTTSLSNVIKIPIKSNKIR